MSTVFEFTIMTKMGIQKKKKKKLFSFLLYFTYTYINKFLHKNQQREYILLHKFCLYLDLDY